MKNPKVPNTTEVPVGLELPVCDEPVSFMVALARVNRGDRELRKATLHMSLAGDCFTDGELTTGPECHPAEALTEAAMVAVGEYVRGLALSGDACDTAHERHRFWDARVDAWVSSTLASFRGLLAGTPASEVAAIPPALAVSHAADSDLNF
jgi:hypothetical protein